MAVWPHGCSGRLAGQGCPVCPAGPGCLMCPWAAARPRAVRAASFARRVASKPGQAPPPPTGTAVRPLCQPAISHAIPLSVFQMLKSNRWYSAVFERASIRVVGELHAKFVWGWVMPPPTGTAARPSGPPLPGALHTCGARSLMGSALEGLRLRARKSSPCSVWCGCEREKVRPVCSNWPKFSVFALAGRVFSRKSRWRGGVGRTFSRRPMLRPGLVAIWRTSGWWRWGFCTTRSLLAACRRRVEPPCSAIPPDW